MKKTRSSKIQPYIKAVQSAKKQFLSLTGNNKPLWDRESLYAIMQIEQNKDSAALRACETASITQAVVNLALTGSTLNPMLKEAYFAARDGKCTLEFSYKGLIAIATSEGAVTSINAHVVYKWDTFHFEQGTKAHINYAMNLSPPVDPDEMAKDPKLVLDNVIAAFSIARLPNGEQTFIVLPKWKLAKTWRETGAIDNPVNLKWPEEWFRKTAIRYHSKTLPKAVKLVTAVSLMNDHDGVKAKGKPESEFLKRIKKKGERQIDSEE